MSNDKKVYAPNHEAGLIDVALSNWEKAHFYSRRGELQCKFCGNLRLPGDPESHSATCPRFHWSGNAGLIDKRERDLTGLGARLLGILYRIDPVRYGIPWIESESSERVVKSTDDPVNDLIDFIVSDWDDDGLCRYCDQKQPMVELEFEVHGYRCPRQIVVDHEGRPGLNGPVRFDVKRVGYLTDAGNAVIDALRLVRPQIISDKMLYTKPVFTSYGRARPYSRRLKGTTGSLRFIASVDSKVMTVEQVDTDVFSHDRSRGAM